MFGRLYKIIAIMVLPLMLAGCATLGAMMSNNSSDQADKGITVEDLTVAEHEVKGDELLRRGNMEVAFAHYNSALNKGADTASIRFKRGVILAAQDLDEQALVEFSQALEKNPNYAAAHESVGLIYFKSGLNREARSSFTKAMELNPNLWRSHSYMGILHNRDSNFEAAAQEFQAALKLNPDHPGTLNNLGLTLLMQGRDIEAVPLLSQSVRNGNADPRTLNNLGLALARLGRKQEAFEAFAAAGGEAKAYNNLGYSMLLMGDNETAAELFQKAIDLSPTYYTAAFENLKRARLSKAIDTTLGPNQSIPSFDGTGPMEVFPATSAGTTATVSQLSDFAVQSLPANDSSNTRYADADATPEVKATAPADAIPEQTAIIQPVSFSSEPASTPKAEPVMVIPEPTYYVPSSKDREDLVKSPTDGDTSDSTSSIEVAAVAPKDTYSLHVSSWRHESEAQGVILTALEKNLQARYIRLEIPGKGTWYRVLVGEYGSKSEARKDAARIRELMNSDYSSIILNPAINETEEAS